MWAAKGDIQCPPECLRNDGPSEDSIIGDRLKDKVALISGAGSVGPGWGNGKATAVLFARQGATIFAVDIDEAAAAQTAGIIESEGGRCAVCAADVAKADSVEAMVRQCIDTFGRIDVLHNNVGILTVGGPVETSEADWDLVNNVNLKSMFLSCKHVLPVMEKQGSGAIVNISSISGLSHLGVDYISYSSTKAAILQFTRSVAMQYARKNIRVNAVLPGLMNTPMVVKHLSDAYADGDVEKMIEMREAVCPMGKMGDAWDVAHAALFLASDEAKYVTGAQLVVDGGLTCKSV